MSLLLSTSNGPCFISGLCLTLAMVSVPGEIFGTCNQWNWSSYESCEGKNNTVQGQSKKYPGS